ncbi:hypothetical protein [Mesorhizobium sp. M7A.F.Ca.MR.245.00.0.0]|uniref:hypothetical protein n=1 Tax=Mesorhizobium sp. M7A.F.Ca.MR.245.00.0.0 TaxID=2496778 RepID=UPI000FCAEE66|nr:hypothetical protein [Mesorhizobium sp. M7A.F.Ca.MR.245.00.0.0]RUV21752.1 hypothetical protein EOB80_09680 [Mesorhizobium sp. M7A.F.Ca.MR.245.00.0.0]RUV49908.1 hypothetical protein EOB77_17540 [Mesorhizobium sp. M7A.F.Ca.MR.228.00.0.0]
MLATGSTSTALGRNAEVGFLPNSQQSRRSASGPISDIGKNLADSTPFVNASKQVIRELQLARGQVSKVDVNEMSLTASIVIL